MVNAIKVDIDQFYKKMVDVHLFELKNKKLPTYMKVIVDKKEYKIPGKGSRGFIDGHNRVNNWLIGKEDIPEYVNLIPLDETVTPTPTPTPAPTPQPVPTPPIDPNSTCLTTTLQQGSNGQCVIYLQQKLQDFGFYKASVDGDFGPVTKQAVIDFQNKTGHTPDGVCGPKTWSSIPTYQTPKPGIVTGDQWVLDTLRSRYGTLNNGQDLCGILQDNGHYLYYYDQQQSQEQTVNSLSGNCADITNDIILPVARALGLSSRGVHCQVKCADGNWYGHYIAEVNGELWDGAGWAKTHPFNELICNNGYQFLHYEGDYIP